MPLLITPKTLSGHTPYREYRRGRFVLVNMANADLAAIVATEKLRVSLCTFIFHFVLPTLNCARLGALQW